MKNVRRMLALALALLLPLGTVGALAAQANAVKAVKIDKAHFPDEAFMSFIKKNVDKNGDGKLSVKEIKAVTKLMLDRKGIADLKGVELFVNLTYLDCDTNKLTRLDVSKNTKLDNLNCSRNELAKLDLSKNKKLKKLNCNSNKLKNLNLSKNTALENVSCKDNAMTKLTLGTHKKLFNLSCVENNLKTLNIKGCPRLISIVNKSKPGKGSEDVIWMDDDGEDDACVWIDKQTKLMNGTKTLYKP